MVDGANATAVLVVSIVFSALMTIALFLRFLARHLQGSLWAPDDFVFGIAFVLTWACAGSDCIIAGYGLGPAQNKTPSLKEQEYDDDLDRYFIASQICWVFAATSTKLALLLFYFRIDPRRWIQTAIYILAGLLAVFWVAGVTFYATNRGFSLSGNAGIGAVNSLLGVATMAIPFTAIWTNSDMSLRSKARKTLWYGMGWLAVAVGIARLASYGIADMHLYEQKSWSLLLCWSIVEPCLWLIAGSAPTIRQLWRRQQQRGSARERGETRFQSSSNRSFAAVPGTAADDIGLTALPPVPGATPDMGTQNHQRNPSDHRTVDSRLTGPLEEPDFTRQGGVENQGDTARRTPRVSRRGSTRTDAGMYTHWRTDDEDDDDYDG